MKTLIDLAAATTLTLAALAHAATAQSWGGFGTQSIGITHDHSPVGIGITHDHSPVGIGTAQDD